MKLHRSILAVISRLVPGTMREEWRREWESELDARERRLDAWDRVSNRRRLRLIRESSGAFWDALWLRSSRWQSLRFLLRQWRVTAPAGLSLALALAATISTAGIYEALLLRPPGVNAPDRLLTMYVASPTEQYDAVSREDYDFYRAHSTAVASWAAQAGGISIFTVPDVQERLVSMAVSENYFQVLGIQPRIGSIDFPSAKAADRLHAVISEALWQRLGGDPGIVGRPLRVGSTTLRVIGVAPATFTGMNLIWRTEIWFPIAGAARVAGVPDPPRDRTSRALFLLGRLAPGAMRQAANAEVAGLSRQLADAYPSTDSGRRAFLTDTTIIPPEEQTWVRPTLGAVVGVALLTLCVAGANTINLLLGLALSRRHEMLVRTALGASRLQLALPLVRESLALCIAAGAAGVGAAYAALIALSGQHLSLGTDIPAPTLELRPDAALLLAAASVIAVAGVVIGIVPAWRAAADGLSGALTRELAYAGARGGRVRGALILVQVSVATMVLVGVGVTWKSVANLHRADVGFSAPHLMQAGVPLEMGQYDESTGRVMYERLRTSIEAIPGVEAVSLSSGMPIEACCGRILLRADPAAGHDARDTSVMSSIIDDRFFSTIGMRLLAGRDFDRRDDARAPRTVIVNQRLADTRWPGTPAVGRHLTIVDEGKAMDATVVGVAATGKYSDLDESPEPFVYLPLRQHYVNDVSVIARTSSDSTALKRAIHDAIVGLDPRLDVWTVRAFSDTLALEMKFPILMLRAITIVAGLALVLTTVGLYGTVLHAVRQRQKEIGIRVALGAKPGNLMALVLRRVIWLGAAGAALGVGLSIAILPVVASAFYGVRSIESGVFVTVAAASLVMCAGVAYVAARPWTRTSVVEILRAS